MIEKKMRHVWNSKTVIDHYILASGNKEPTAKQVLDYITDRDWCSDYELHRYESNDTASLMQRINLLWVWPLFVITIPFQWICTGGFGLKRDSRMGRIVSWFIKL
jgi:hypothetical protein